MNIKGIEFLGQDYDGRKIKRYSTILMMTMIKTVKTMIRESRLIRIKRIGMWASSKRIGENMKSLTFLLPLSQVWCEVSFSCHWDHI